MDFLSQTRARGDSLAVQKCKVNLEALKDVADLLTENYAKTMFVHTFQVVTEKQKKATVPGLLKLFQDLLVNKMPPDAGRDPVFELELSVYFQKQPGYEPLVHIHQNVEVHTGVRWKLGFIYSASRVFV